MSAGHIRQRGPGAWELKFDIAPEPTTGRRRTRTATFRGTSSKAARAHLRELLRAVDRAEHIDRSPVAVAALVRERIAVWEVSPSTRETYLNDAKMLVPIGHVPAQKLTTRDVEQWHGELRSRGLSPATIRKAHRLLVRVLGEAVRHGLPRGTSPQISRRRRRSARRRSRS